MDLTLKLSSGFLVATGTIAGAVTLNPIVLGVISGAGMLAGVFSETKNFKRKIELTKFPYTSYEKILVDIKERLN